MIAKAIGKSTHQLDRPIGRARASPHSANPARP
jgi:hypothetical protein